MKRLAELAGDMEITLHRAFDVCKDPGEALEQAVMLGIGTVLTSGQENSALKGADCLAELQRQGRRPDYTDGRCGSWPGEYP